MQQKRNPAGIRTRHSRNCATSDARRCNCKPTYEAFVFSVRDGRRIAQVVLDAGCREGLAHRRARCLKEGDDASADGDDAPRGC